MINDLLWATGLLVYISYVAVMIGIAVGAFRRRGGRRFFSD